MLSQIKRGAKNLLSRLSSAANRLFRPVTEPARTRLVTGTLADVPRSRTELLAENALLRQQLIVLRRQVKTPRLTWRERMSLLVLARWVPNLKQVLQIIKPETLLRWHREGFRLYWKWKSRVHVRTQPQRLASETIALIERLARENPLWGTERIRGELLKLNIKVAKRTIQKYMQVARSKPPTGQSWSTFLKTHGKDIWARDFLPVVTLFFKTIHAFVIVHNESRRVVHFGVTEHPTDEWGWTAIDPVSKLWLVALVGPRTKDMACLVVHSICTLLVAGGVPAFASDGLMHYFYTLTAHFGQWETDGQGKERWQVSSLLQYGQVIGTV